MNYVKIHGFNGFEKARSSAVERYIDTVEVGGSRPPVPTIFYRFPPTHASHGYPATLSREGRGEKRRTLYVCVMRDARKISRCVTLPAAHNVFLFKDEIASSVRHYYWRTDSQ